MSNRSGFRDARRADRPCTDATATPRPRRTGRAGAVPRAQARPVPWSAHGDEQRERPGRTRPRGPVPTPRADRHRCERAGLRRRRHPARAAGSRSRCCTPRSRRTPASCAGSAPRPRSRPSLHHPNIMAVYDWGEDDAAVHGGRAARGREPARDARPRQPADDRAGRAHRPRRRRRPRLRALARHRAPRRQAREPALRRARRRAHRRLRPRARPRRGVVDRARGRGVRHRARTRRPSRRAVCSSTRAPTSTRSRSCSSRRSPARSRSRPTPRSARSRRARSSPIIAPPEMGPLQAVVERAGPDRARRPLSRRRHDGGRARRRRRSPASDRRRWCCPGVVDGCRPASHAGGQRGGARRHRPLFDQDAAAECDPGRLRADRRHPTLRGRLGLPPRTATQREPPAATGSARRARRLRSRDRARHLGARAGGRDRGRRRRVSSGSRRSTRRSRGRRRGLTLHVVHRASPDPDGVVLEQDPAPGAWLYGGRSINVIVSRACAGRSCPPSSG